MSKLQMLLSGEVKPGLYRFTSRAACDRLAEEAERAGWRCFCVDGRAISDKAAFLAAFAAALHFPDYFGRNWDAFEECLHDLSWERDEETQGFVIVYDAADQFATARPGEWTTARHIFSNAIAAWQKAGTPMIVLLRGASAAAADLDSL